MRMAAVLALAIIGLGGLAAAPTVAATFLRPTGLAAAPTVAATFRAPSPLLPSLTARATTTSDPEALTKPPQTGARPAGHRLSPRRARAIAGALPAVRSELARHRGSYGVAFLKGTLRWQVSYYGARNQEIAQVLIDDSTGRVLEAWTGFQVAWTMARGYPGAFGRKSNALYVWLPLSVLFVLPFINPRRLRSLLHLDLLVLSAFSVSLAFFTHGDVDVSVPFVYPLLVYLLVRMLFAARPLAARPLAARPLASRPARRPPALRLLVHPRWLVIVIVFLVGFRVGLNVTDSNVIDVGYAGVIGAHRLTSGQALYGAFPSDNSHGDTYGPVVYEAYVPFERLLGWSGRWDDLPAAHAASVVFDLLSLLLVFLLGRRVRGPTLGIALAYAWATYPFTLFAANSNTNDGLVTVLILGALLAVGQPAARGALTALAGLSKFAPLALAPLMATHGLAHEVTDRRTPVGRTGRQWLLGRTGRQRLLGRTGRRTPRSGLLRFALGFTVAAALALLPVVLNDAPGKFYDQTLAYQSNRGSPFSIWGLYGVPTGFQIAVQVGALLLALLAAVIPRRPDLIGLAAMSAALLIALQLGVTHWFYLYLVWFFPLVMLVLLGGREEHLLDGLRAQALGARDHDPHQPGILV